MKIRVKSHTLAYAYLCENTSIFYSAGWGLLKISLGGLLGRRGVGWLICAGGDASSGVPVVPLGVGRTLFGLNGGVALAVWAHLPPFRR